MGHVAPGARIQPRTAELVEPGSAEPGSAELAELGSAAPASRPHRARGPESSGKGGMDSAMKWMLALNKSQTNSKTSRWQSPEPAGGRDPCCTPFPRSPAPLCHAAPRAEAPELRGRWSVPSAPLTYAGAASSISVRPPSPGKISRFLLVLHSPQGAEHKPGSAWQSGVASAYFFLHTEWRFALCRAHTGDPPGL